MKLTKTQLKQIIKEELTKRLDEKSKSKSQQRFMGMVKNCQETGDCPSDKVKKAAQSMSKKATEDFASTKHKGLPEKIDEVAPAPPPTYTWQPEDAGTRADMTRLRRAEEEAVVIATQLADKLDAMGDYGLYEKVDEVIKTIKSRLEDPSYEF